MWAGGRLQSADPLRVGDAVHARFAHRVGRRTRRGAAATLVFVLVRHEIAQRRGPGDDARSTTSSTAPPPSPATRRRRRVPAEHGATWQREIVPDPVLLFRYSALTFNGHRIHYDRSYVTEVEGYPGLIVHGPLIATLLLDLLRRERAGRRVRSFNFKAVRPMFDLQPFRVYGQPAADGKTVAALGARP